MSVEPAKPSDAKVYVASGTITCYDMTWPFPEKEKPLPPDGTVLADGSIVRTAHWESWTEEGETKTFRAHLEIPNSALEGDEEAPVADQTQS